MYLEMGIPKLTQGFGADPDPNSEVWGAYTGGQGDYLGNWGDPGFSSTSGPDPWPTYEAPDPKDLTEEEWALINEVDVSGPGPKTGFDWAGRVLAPVVQAATQIGTAYAKQELLGESTYLRDKNGNILKNAQGQPILANSAQGIKVATAAKAAGLGNSWIMPVAIGVGVLAILLLVMKRGKR